MPLTVDELRVELDALQVLAVRLALVAAVREPGVADYLAGDLLDEELPTADADHHGRVEARVKALVASRKALANAVRPILPPPH